ncbi:TadE/TadG family type IV pilus assembly protein [Roseomonas rosulenta]|uniref:TadE/TadG family type IV pilus assembly protein n=1 Tax=Roseomonas rosulenta TaxID=2748667 RepID=UPI0018DFF8F3|nr:TadE/TadG family type IV pilus assembly protein [Roseomonas rosulenta]
MGRRGHRRRDSGASALEFALVSPLLIFVMLAVADFGNALQQSIRLEAAVRAGAQTVLGGTYNETRIRNVVSANLTDWRLTTDTPSGNVTLTTSLVCRCPGTNGTVFDCTTGDPVATCGAPGDFNEYVSITATRPYARLFVFPSSTLRGNVELRLR